MPVAGSVATPVASDNPATATLRDDPAGAVAAGPAIALGTAPTRSVAVATTASIPTPKRRRPGILTLYARGSLAVAIQIPPRSTIAHRDTA